MALGELLALSASSDRRARVHHELAIPADVAARVAQWARHDGAAPETAWIAAWMILLARWSGHASVAGGEAGTRADLPARNDGRIRSLAPAVDLSSPAGPFLRAVDAARQAGAAASDDTGAAVEWAWLNKGRADAEADRHLRRGAARDDAGPDGARPARGHAAGRGRRRPRAPAARAHRRGGLRMLRRARGGGCATSTRSGTPSANASPRTGTRRSQRAIPRPRCTAPSRRKPRPGPMR